MNIIIRASQNKQGACQFDMPALGKEFVKIWQIVMFRL